MTNCLEMIKTAANENPHLRRFFHVLEPSAGDGIVLKKQQRSEGQFVIEHYF